MPAGKQPSRTMGTNVHHLIDFLTDKQTPGETRGTSQKNKHLTSNVMYKREKETGERGTRLQVREAHERTMPAGKQPNRTVAPMFTK